jgi:translation initiation factor IF-3
MDFNKFKYEQARREREAKKKHHIAKLKEVKFKPHIEKHDYQVKLQRLMRFLARGDKAKVTVVFRGRELGHVELGRRVLEQLVTDLKSIGRVEREPILEGRFMTMIFSPDHAALKRAKKPPPTRQSPAPSATPAGAQSRPEQASGSANNQEGGRPPEARSEAIPG